MPWLARPAWGYDARECIGSKHFDACCAAMPTVRVSHGQKQPIPNMKLKKLSAIGLLAVLALATLMFSLHIITGPAACALVGLYQLAMLARSKPRPGVFYTSALSQDQIDEFSNICTELSAHLPTVKGADARLKSLEKANDELRGELKKLRKNGFLSPTGVRWLHDVPFVSNECAAAITSIIVMDAASQKRLDSMIPDNAKRERILLCAQEHLGFSQRAGGALTPGDIPLPTIYVPQVIELVFAYGQARKFATVFPMGNGTVKLPRLQPGEDTFGFLGAGTAGMSQAIPEKEVSAALVTFTANKFGGLIRIPYELEVDTFIPIGQFLARYIARQFAKMEDNCLFNSDGTATYAGIIGIAKYCSTPVAGATPYLTTLGAGQTVPSDATLAAFRAMRANVNPAVLANMAANGQTQAAYYMHPTMESLLVTFNTIGSPLIYRPQNGSQPPTLDGFPIRWIGVSQPNGTTAAPGANLAFFGDLTYWYLGERGEPRIEVSKEVFFATDELAMRALERIDVEAMALDAMSTLQTALA
jgi:HK97 family phage major capsid protein